MQNEAVAHRLVEIFGDDLRHARRVDYEAWRTRPSWQRLLELLVRCCSRPTAASMSATPRGVVELHPVDHEHRARPQVHVSIAPSAAMTAVFDSFMRVAV